MTIHDIPDLEARSTDETSRELRGRVALVTGAWGHHSIGRAIALAFAQAGADVIVSDISPSADSTHPDSPPDWRGIESVADEVTASGQRGLAIECDIADESQVRDLTTTAYTAMGRIDIVVNAARAIVSHERSLASETSQADWDLVMAVNLRGPLFVCREAARHMIEDKRGGSIINVSSTAGQRPAAGNAAYCVSKAGLDMLTRVLALELAGHDIRVNAIAPGVIDTSRVRQEEIRKATTMGLTLTRYRSRQLAERANEIPLRRVGDPDDVAVVARFLASDAGAYITGHIINVDGGLLLV